MLIRESLKDIYDEAESREIAALAMEHLTGIGKKEAALQKETVFPEEKREVLSATINRLQQHEPIQYIMNKAWFYHLELYIDKDVLIPRPETEELVDWIIRDVKASGKDVFNKSAAEADETTKFKILDVGTGSGCIALALKNAMPKAEIWGCDISDRALNIARRNGAMLDIRVDFQSVDYLDPAQQKHLPSVDLVVSNPPYIPRRDQSSMQPNVLQYEPHTALFVDNDDPLLFYKALVQFGEHRLHPAGALYMEVHEDLAGDVVALFEKEMYQCMLRKDMQGKNRMVKAWK